jgi:D-sedoheptulose 7-phosphate isomerase
MEISPYFDFLKGLLCVSEEKLNQIAEMLVEASILERSIWVVGNGGSASTAEHFETDLSFIRKGNVFPKLRVSALTSNSALVSAIANDIGYEKIFSHQLFRKADPEDLCILISASGNSENLINAALACKEIGLKSIGLLGFDGGKLAGLVDSSIIVRTEIGKYGPVEDLHLAICHAVAELVGSKLERTNN